MTVYLVEISGGSRDFYDNIHRFEHVQVSNFSVAVDTGLSREGLSSALGSSVVSIEMLQPNTGLGARPEFQGLNRAQYEWFNERGF